MTSTDPMGIAERARALIEFDPVTGLAVWRADGRKHKAGGRAGYLHKNSGYWSIRFEGTLYWFHRFVWLMHFGIWPDQIDHINGDRADNRLANIRSVSNAVNAQNQRQARRDNKVGMLGVSPNRSGRFSAFIKTSIGHKFLGSFATPEEAHSVFVAAKRRYHEGCTI